jgi:hypothetical protein
LVREVAPALDRALSLAKRGYHVFPVNQHKKPLTRKGQYSDERWSASSDLATVTHVFRKFPHAQVGLATGESGLVVIDLDKKTGGLDWLKKNDAKVRANYIVRTPRGGLHLYYRAREGETVKDSASIIAPGVDVRGDGGYVVAYPEVHHGSLSGLTSLPDELYEAATKKQRLRFDFDRAHPQQGERSDRLVKLGGALVAKGKSWSVVEKRIRAEADACDPPFDVGELERTVLKSLRGYYTEEHAARKPRKLKTAKGDEIAHDEDRLLLSAEELNARQDLPPQLVEGLLDQQTECSIIGPSGAAKSLLALALGLAVGTGKRFYGHKTKKGPVLYLCGEGAGGIRRRFQALAHAWDVDPRGVPFAVLPRSLDMEGPELEAALEEFSARYGDEPVMVIIDTYSRYVGRENDENASGDLYAFFAAVGEVFGGIARVVLHHTGHGEMKRSRGTSAWAQAVDTEFIMSHETEEKGQPPTFESVRVMENTKQKDGELAEPKYFQLRRVATRSKREGRTLFSVVLEEVDAPEIEREKTAAQATEGLGQNQQAVLAMCVRMDGAARADIIAALVKDRMPANRVSEALRTLRRRGYLAVDPEGRVQTSAKAKRAIRLEL